MAEREATGLLGERTVISTPSHYRACSALLPWVRALIAGAAGRRIELTLLLGLQESAAKTALMLNGGTLDGSTILVTSEDVEAPALANVKPVESTAQTPSEKEGHDVEQEDKPRSAVLAEYLAHGYTFSDDIIEKSIAADKREFLKLLLPPSSELIPSPATQNTASPPASSPSSTLLPPRSLPPLSLTSSAPARSSPRSTRSRV